MALISLHRWRKRDGAAVEDGEQNPYIWKVPYPLWTEVDWHDITVYIIMTKAYDIYKAPRQRPVLLSTSIRTTMSTQKFVGTQPVDEFSAEAVAKVDDDELTKREINRDSAKEPGANKRAGVATRDPKEFDTTGQHNFGDPKPVQDPVL